MVEALLVILLCQLAGEVLGQLSGWGIPGPIIGLALLVIGLAGRAAWRKRAAKRLETQTIPTDLAKTAHGILGHLSLLFVPAATGVILHLERIGAAWFPIALALILGTAISLTVTALTFVGISKLLSLEDPDDDRTDTPPSPPSRSTP